MFTVYILHSLAHDKYYIGQTNDIEKRLVRHNSGYVKSTKAFKPWELVYTENFDTRTGSMQRETHLKAMKYKSYINKLVYASR